VPVQDLKKKNHSMISFFPLKIFSKANFKHKGEEAQKPKLKGNKHGIFFID